MKSEAGSPVAEAAAGWDSGSFDSLRRCVYSVGSYCELHGYVLQMKKRRDRTPLLCIYTLGSAQLCAKYSVTSDLARHWHLSQMPAEKIDLSFNTWVPPGHSTSRRYMSPATTTAPPAGGTPGCCQLQRLHKLFTEYVFLPKGLKRSTKQGAKLQKTF